MRVVRFADIENLQRSVVLFYDELFLNCSMNSIRPSVCKMIIKRHDRSTCVDATKLKRNAHVTLIGTRKNDEKNSRTDLDLLDTISGDLEHGFVVLHGPDFVLACCWLLFVVFGWRLGKKFLRTFRRAKRENFLVRVVLLCMCVLLKICLGRR